MRALQILADYANLGIVDATPKEAQGMPTRNVVLTVHQERIIAELVGSGRYQNASEVLREGLRLIEQRDSRDAARLKFLRHAARAGFADFAAGRFVELENEAIEETIEVLGRQARRQGRGIQP